MGDYSHERMNKAASRNGLFPILFFISSSYLDRNYMSIIYH